MKPPTPLTVVVFTVATLTSILILFSMPLLIILLKTISCSIPCLMIWFWLNWSSFEQFLKWRAQVELMNEFGAAKEQVSIESFHLRFGENGSIVIEFKNTKVGEDFLKIKLLRITCHGILSFLTLPGLQILPYQFILGYHIREFDSIEVDGCYMHAETDFHNSIFYKDHIEKERKISKIKLKKGKNDLHKWREFWKEKTRLKFHYPTKVSEIEKKGVASSSFSTPTKQQQQLSLSEEQKQFNEEVKTNYDNFHDDDDDDDDDEEESYGIEEVAKIGSMSEMFNMLRSRPQNKKSSNDDIQEICDFKNIEKRLLDASTIKCGLVRCTNFEFVIKDKHFQLSEPWELIGFVGTYEKFRYKVCFEIRGEKYGVLPTIFKDTGKEAVKETVAHLRTKVEESRFGKLIGNIRSRNASSPAPTDVAKLNAPSPAPPNADL